MRVNSSLVCVVIGIITPGLIGLSAAAASDRRLLVDVPPTEIRAPDTITEGESFELELVGYYPNTCYSPADISIQIDKRDYSIFIMNTAYLDAEFMCAMMLVPYTRAIDIGPLMPGEYSVFTYNQKKTNELLASFVVHAIN